MNNLLYFQLKRKKEIKDNPIIELKNNTNKTIIHVLDYSNGFGDYLRGSILLAQYAKKYNINFKMDVSNHYIHKFLEDEPEQLLNIKPILICFGGTMNDLNNIIYSNSKLVPTLNNFIKSNEDNIYITTNHFYDNKLVTDDIKNNINSFFKFKPKYYNIVKNLIKLDKYKVLHIRCNDDYFNKEFNSDKLLVEIIKLQWDYNTIVISNNYSIKLKLNKLFGFQYIDNSAIHTGKVTEKNYNDLESTIIDYIILSKSENTHCFSFYHHGSGFSEQCSMLYDIPYKMVYLTTESIKASELTDFKLLINHYNNLLDWPIAPTEAIKSNENLYNNISFITLTNTGYVDYTLNCLESLRRINTKINLECYCVGIEGYNKLKNKGFNCNLIDDEKNSKFQIYQGKNWSNITYYKFEIIHKNLLNNKFVCITDGDIVYENNIFFDFLLQNIGDNDMLIQSEGLEHDDLCSGFMFIKSNELTLSLFDPKNVELFKNEQNWDDQVYVNKNKYKLKYKTLPLSLFPTGKYYYTYSNNINPYMIHFNWIKGHEKKQKMINYNKWFNKVKICQYGTDGFGHQIEGMLRLISLSINDKADYQYNYKRTYQFEHSNFEIKKLKSYLSSALKYLLKEKDPEKDQVLNICQKEQRAFSEIIIKDTNYEDNIYFYDGVTCSIPEKLPPNFETNKEIEKSLPLLKMAFVIKNKYLPKASYDNNTLINVCCHIRLGDAIGQRILDNENIYEVIKYFQKQDKYRIIIHTDGNVDKLKSDNTIIYDSKVDVLQVFSDFIHADILIINYSSLSIAAHLLGSKDQKVICPSKAGDSFKHRVLSKCQTCNEFLDQNK